MEIPIGNGFYQSDSLPISNQECTNLFPNIPQTENALSQATLFGTAGSVEAANSGLINNVNRGCHVKDGLPYYLNGTTLFRKDSSFDVEGKEVFTLTSLGIIPGIKRASFADNGKQLMVIAEGDGFIIDESSGTPFQIISDADFKANGTPEQVKFSDGFFLVTTDTKKWIKSAANDGLSWNALDFSTAEADPDNIVSIIIHKGKPFIAGTETIEEFSNRGTGGFPYQRTGFAIDKGVSSPFGMVNTSGSFMFIGGSANESPAIWTLSGSSVQKVSNTAIDAVLSRMPSEEISTSFAYSYAQSGAYFVGFSFASRVFEFNTVTDRWHERVSRITDSKGVVSNVRWRMNSICAAFNKIFIADSIDGRIGILDTNILTEYGDPISRSFSIPPISNGGRSFSIPMLEITMEGGVGDAVLDPQIRMSTSEDGKTFSDELSRGFGKVGEFFRRSIWYGLGWFPRFCVIRFETSAAVKVVCIKLEADIVSGS